MQSSLLAYSKEESKENYPLYKDKNWLTEQYWGFDLTASQVAELCNSTQFNVLKYIHKYDIPIRPRIYYHRDQYGRKKCVKCGQWKEITEYYLNGKRKKGWLPVRYNRCKSCAKEDSKKWAIDKQTNTNYKYTVYKSAAKKRGYCFKLNKKDFEILVKSNCHYCGMEPLTLNGIDRLNNDKGYELENCVPCCPLCNWMKKDMNLTEFSEKIICLAKWALTYKNKEE